MPTEMSWPGFSIRPSVNSSSASPRSSRPRSETNFASGNTPSSGPSLASLIRQRPEPAENCTAGGCPATDTTYSPDSRSIITWATVAKPSSHCWRRR